MRPRTSFSPRTAFVVALLLFATCAQAVAADWKVVNFFPTNSPARFETHVWIRQDRVSGNNPQGDDVKAGAPLSLATVFAEPDGTPIPSVIEVPKAGSAVLDNGELHNSTVTIPQSNRLSIHGDRIVVSQRIRLLFTHRGPEFLLRFRIKGVELMGHGTEFGIDWPGEGHPLTIAHFDGVVDVYADGGTHLSFTNLGSAEPKALVILSPTEATNAQIRISETAWGDRPKWWLYYPVVLTTNDIPKALFLEPLAKIYRRSLEAYQRGDFAAAYANLQLDTHSAPPEAVDYIASLELAAGEPARARRLWEERAAFDRHSGAPGLLMAAIEGVECELPVEATASEKLAFSWSLQAHGELDQALKLVRHLARTNGEPMIQGRLAQLEFAAGNLGRARTAVDRTLQPGAMPDSVAALTISGWLSLAEGVLARAETLFQRAVGVDPNYAEALLGLGLLEYRRGNSEAALRLIQVAARRQPGRAMYRAYLGRIGLQESLDPSYAEEAAAALRVEPADPTGWWFSALENFRTNRFNQAARQLTRALAENDARASQRTRSMLDADRAVRTANLAAIYQSAGLDQLALQQASYAIAADPLSHSAHQFLADSYDRLRDPARFQNRYDALWLNELLLAGLLTPVGAGPTSAHMSQDEYGRLAESPRSVTSFGSEIRSDGLLHGYGSRSELLGASSYSLDFDWMRADRREYRGEIDRFESYAQVKHQFGLADTGILLTRWSDFSSGDNIQRYDSLARSNQSRYEESQLPIAVGMWRHEWTAASQTMAMMGYLQNQQRSSSDTNEFWVIDPIFGNYRDIQPGKRSYDSSFGLWTGEITQMHSSGEHTFEIGVRAEGGGFHNRSYFADPNLGAFDTGVVAAPLNDFSAFEYHAWKPARNFTVFSGLTAEYLEYPSNVRRSAVSPGSEIEKAILPKVGIVWRPSELIGVRAAYARTLAGVSFDELFRLEPAQFAGIPFTYRDLVPQANGGPIDGNLAHSAQLNLDLALPRNFHAGSLVRWDRTSVARETMELVEDPNILSAIGTTSTREQLDFHSIEAESWLGQLIDADSYWSFSTRIRSSSVDTWQTILPVSKKEDATLFGVGFSLGANYRSGFFWRFDARIFYDHGRLLEMSGSSYVAPGVTQSSFNQSDVLFGWRFPAQRAEVSFGVLNLGGRNYEVSPLSMIPEFPRERVFSIKCRLSL